MIYLKTIESVSQVYIYFLNQDVDKFQLLSIYKNSQNVIFPRMKDFLPK
jgi:hypothetical protein